MPGELIDQFLGNDVISSLRLPGESFTDFLKTQSHSFHPFIFSKTLAT